MCARRSYPFQKYAPWCVFILFVFKVTVTCIWVVRPWDVPDEVGHFSYIRDLATWKGLPVLHETLLDKEIWEEFAPDSAPNPGSNWIAQHPPLYHVVMVPVYWVGALFGTSFWGSFYLIRIVTSVIFGLGIVILMKALRETGLSPGVALGLGLMLASIPNHTYLAGAVNHDSLVFLFGCLVLLYWVRFTQSDSDSDFIRLCLALGLGSLVKYTFLVLFPPVLIVTALSLRFGNGLSRKRLLQGLLFLSLPISFWMVRNLLIFGEALPIDTTGFQSDTPLELSFIEFGQELPVFSILTQTFLGLLGWMGDLTLKVRWLQIYSIYQQAFTWPVCLLLVLSIFYLIKDALGNTKRMAYSFASIFVMLILFYTVGWWKSEYSYFLPLFLTGILVFGGCLGEFLYKLSIKRLDTGQTIEMGSAFVFIFFLSVHFYKIYSFSIPGGALQGTFGRYYLAVIGFFLVGFFSKGLRRFPLASQSVLIFAMIYSCTELYVWLHEAIPFFNVHG